MKDKGNKGLGRRALAGITWTLLGEIVANITRIVGVAWLARLLSREDFGIVAIAMTVILFAARFKEIGLGLALVQRKEIVDDHISTTWGVAFVLGTALTVGVFLAAGPIADLYGTPAAADPMRALSSLFLIRAISATPRALCQRELKFRVLATINVSSYVAGTVTSIACALAGLELWSLVIGYIVEGALEALLILVVQPPRVRPRIRRSAFRDLVGFGSGHTIANLANYFATQGDNIVIGRHFGPELLGAYDRAYTLMKFPAQIFTTVAGSVLFSSFAKLQDDPERLGLMFRRVLFSTSIVLLPASAGLVVLAPETIDILLGPKWSEVIVPFQVLAASMLFRTTYKVSGLVARSAGAVLKIAVYQVAYAVAVIGGAIVSLRWGVVGVAVTTSIAVALHFANLTRLALQEVRIGWRAVIAAHRDGVILAALSAAGSYPVAYVLRTAELPVAVVVLGTIVAGGVPPIVFGLLQIRRRNEDWIWIADRVRTVVRNKKSKTKAPKVRED